MKSDDDTVEAITSLARSLRDLQQQAAQQYEPVVDDILRTRSRDTRHIEHTLDRLLSFCGHENVLRMYKNLCARREPLHRSAEIQEELLRRGDCRPAQRR